MFLKSEVGKLEKLYETVPAQELEDFLEEDEVELIKDKGLAYFSLKNFVFVPKTYDKGDSTLRFQRLALDLDLGDWLKSIANNIRYSPDMLLEVAFSFIVKVGIGSEKEYMFAPKVLAPYRKKLSSKLEFLQFAEEIGKMKESAHLSNVFWEAHDQERFRRSGWTPYRLVCNYIWLTK